ncbi:MAG TPA: glycoside hydrolase family 57 protein [Oligoflexus sp.]|uniref:glycoside hydrolase family 57 protein n=1 Tax=Oligoflexus sp. TaxID=1971216 RepID=UPI002D7E29B8|nr:glycoside hydrolase family 57 protein [Oligoflexus sp.]HET9238296.1 glycoside hydrolase family 57 protein [Oligoflexus sp.]
MTSVCFYFQVHQPFRLRKDYDFFRIGTDSHYEDDEANAGILNKVADKCYRPMNQLLLEEIHRWKGKFRVAFSISGVCLEQMERWTPDVIESFQRLVDTGCVEILSETYYHSLASLFSPDEFIEQIALHRAKVLELFHYDPVVFRNTELIFQDRIATVIEELGYRGMIAEGADRILAWRSPNYLYQPAPCRRMALLLKNYRLSDDIAFRFSNRGWESWPLRSETFASWVHQVAGNGEVINLFMDYETFGEHQWVDTGIFDFMRALPGDVLAHPDFSFATPREVIERYQPIGKLSFPDPVSWADVDRDLTAWLGNSIQDSSAERIYRLEGLVKSLGDPELLHTWRKLQTSDHFYYMCTKWFADGDVHKYFSPYESPYDAHVIYNNVVSDFEETLLRIWNARDKEIDPGSRRSPLLDMAFVD